MSALSILLTLAATLSAAAIAGAIALTASDANAKSRHYHANGTGIGIGSTLGGAVVSCRHKRIFFEGCWWVQRTCNGQVTFPKMLSCPDLRR